MRVGAKGQVTIPARLREQAGFLPNTEVEFVLDGEEVRIVRARIAPRRQRETRGQEVIRRLSGSGTGKMTTDEIIALMRGE